MTPDHIRVHRCGGEPIERIGEAEIYKAEGGGLAVYWTGDFGEPCIFDNIHQARSFAQGREIDRLRAELAQAVSAINIADANAGTRTAQRDQARAELEQAHAAGFAEAVAMLRDDSRYANWWSAVPPKPGKPTGRYWDAAARGHLADYLETVRLPLPGALKLVESEPCPDHGKAVTQ